MKAGRHAAYSAVMLAVVLLWFQMTATDTWIQDLLFDNTSHTWLLDSTDSVMSFLFYDGIKPLLVIICLGTVVCLLIFGKSPTAKNIAMGCVSCCFP